MSRTLRNWSSLALFILILGTGFSAHAATSTGNFLPSGQGWLGPDSPLYFLAIWNEKFNTFFTFGAEKKAKEYWKLSEMRFAKYNAEIEAGKYDKAIKTLRKYKDDVARAYAQISKIKDKPEGEAGLREAIRAAVEANLAAVKEKAESLPERSREAGEEIYKDAEGMLRGVHCGLVAFGGKGDKTGCAAP